MFFYFRWLIKQDECWAQIAPTSKVIMEMADALCCIQQERDKERTKTGPDHKNGPVLDNGGKSEQVCNYRSVAFHGSSAFAI